MQTDEPIRLTQYSSKGGCGCKIAPGELATILADLPQGERHPQLLVGFETNDDAGVFRLNDELALVQTTDFFTPIVDDPYDFGRIAAANALSDVYAMGGTPLTVLNLVGFPVGKLDKQILGRILQGAADKVREAGATIVGGHSIDDAEPKFGLAVTGLVHPDRVLTNRAAQPGDTLLLTKPIGVGIFSSAIKQAKLTVPEIAEVTDIMATLNRRAAEVMRAFDVHACTDVTGFGLLGHALEMARGSGVQMRIVAERVPRLARAMALAEAGVVPGGSRKNMEFVRPHVAFADEVSDVERLLLCDAVTSGGLLISVASKEAEQLVSALHEAGVDWAAIIGQTQVKSHDFFIKVDATDGP